MQYLLRGEGVLIYQRIVSFLIIWILVHYFITLYSVYGYQYGDGAGKTD